MSCAACLSSTLRSYHDPPSLLGLGNPPPTSMALAPADGAVKTATKGRKRSMGHMETTLSATLQSGRGRDIAFICQTLEAYDTDQLAQYIASLLRDGMLQRAMLKACAQPLPASLGRRFPSKCVRFASFPPRYKRHVVNMLTAEPLVYQHGDPEELAELLTDSLFNQLFVFGLGVDLRTERPTERACADYEGPIAVVLALRADGFGNRLKNITKATLLSKDWGYVSWSRDVPTQAAFFNGRVIQIPIGDCVVRDARGLTIENNHSTDVALVDHQIGYAQALAPLLKRQHGVEFQNPHEKFEYIASCFEFRGLPTETLKSASVAAPFAEAALATPQLPKTATPTKPRPKNDAETPTN